MMAEYFCLLLTSTKRRVLHILKNPLLSQGYHIIRFNSRGVGRSSGWPSLTGIQEGKDLEELVQWALASIPNTKSLVILVCSEHPGFPMHRLTL